MIDVINAEIFILARDCVARGGNIDLLFRNGDRKSLINNEAQTRNGKGTQS
jgi:hypothetical protein